MEYVDGQQPSNRYILLFALLYSCIAFVHFCIFQDAVLVRLQKVGACRWQPFTRWQITTQMRQTLLLSKYEEIIKPIQKYLHLLHGSSIYHLLCIISLNENTVEPISQQHRPSSQMSCSSPSQFRAPFPSLPCFTPIVTTAPLIPSHISQEAYF